jgi:CRP-like cAMP-binding protein
VIAGDDLARLALFADLEAPQLAEVAQIADEERFMRDDRIIRAGLSGSGFYVILDGEAAVRIDGQERVRLRPGEFFGEVSILTSEAAVADVVAATEELRCAVIAAPELKPLLLRHPSVALRMLEFGARRLRNANLWAG